MTAIYINGRNINDLGAREVFLAGADPGRAIYPPGKQGDYWHNYILLKLFGIGHDFDARDEIGVDLAVQRHELISSRLFSPSFNALRGGELMNWGCQHGIVERIDGPAWRLLLRERQFELVGSETKQRAVRIRGLEGAEAVLAAKLWDRELKRRERARRKRLEKIADSVRRELGIIAKREPEHPLGDALARFAIGSVDTVAGAGDYILDTIADGTVSEAWEIAGAVGDIFRDVCAREVERAAAERRERDAADMADLGALFAEPGSV